MQKTSHAIFNRIYVRLGLVAALVGGVPLISHAAYANLAPPAGWSGGSSGGQFNYGAAANSATISNGTVRTNAALNVAGRAVTVPVSMRFAANAGRVAATAAFAHPGWFVVAGIVIPGMIDAYDYFREEQIEVEQGIWKQKVNNLTCVPNDPACTTPKDPAGTPPANVTTFTYVTNGPFPTGGCAYQGFRHGVSVGYWCVGSPAQTGGQFDPITLPTFVEAFARKPLPNILPEKLPIPLPVELPIINPSPGLNPQPQPLFIPTGNPIRNPNYNPQASPSPENQPFLQPGVRVVPAPTPSNPFQVDLQPVERPQAGPDPLPEAEQNPDTDTEDKPKDEDSKSLCEKHPEILACQKPELDTPEGEISRSNRDVSLQEENIFGGGACPADIYFAPHGLQQMKVWDWNKACGDITTYLKPILIICCSFAAFMILVPGRTE